MQILSYITGFDHYWVHVTGFNKQGFDKHYEDTSKNKIIKYDSIKNDLILKITECFEPYEISLDSMKFFKNILNTNSLINTNIDEKSTEYGIINVPFSTLDKKQILDYLQISIMQNTINYIK
jgi:hypothetical protein